MRKDLVIGLVMFLHLSLATVAPCAAASTGQQDLKAAPTNTADMDYTALIATSSKLSPANREKAAALFSTAFQLWKSGDFGAAALAFRRGLDIDPANAAANYYYGDCLNRSNDLQGARLHLEIARKLGNGTAEQFKAEALLSTLKDIPIPANQLNGKQLEKALIGHWEIISEFKFMFSSSKLNPYMEISGIEGNTLKVQGKQKCCLAGFFDYNHGTINGTHIEIVGKVSINTMILNFELIDERHLVGTYKASSYHGKVEAIKTSNELTPPTTPIRL